MGGREGLREKWIGEGSERGKGGDIEDIDIGRYQYRRTTSIIFSLDNLPTGPAGDARPEALYPESARQTGGPDGGGEHLQETEAGRLVHPLPAWQEHGPHDLQGVHGETSQENAGYGDCPK